MPKQSNDFEALQARYEATHANFATRRRIGGVLTKFRLYVQDRHPRDVFKVDVADYKDLMKQTLSAKTVRNELGYIQSFFKWLVEHDEVNHNPVLDVRKPSIPEQANRWLSSETISALWAAVRTPREWNILALASTTPLDAATMAKMRSSNFDFARNLIRCTRGKTGKAWTFPLRQDVADHFSSFSDFLFPECRFDSESGHRLSKAFAVLSIRALGKNVGLHAFRHTYATEALRSGLDLSTVKELMGHRNISTTALYLTPCEAHQVRDFLDLLPRLATPIEPLPGSPAEQYIPLSDEPSPTGCPPQQSVSPALSTEPTILAAAD